MKAKGWRQKIISALKVPTFLALVYIVQCFCIYFRLLILSY